MAQTAEKACQNKASLGYSAEEIVHYFNLIAKNLFKYHHVKLNAPAKLPEETEWLLEGWCEKLVTITPLAQDRMIETIGAHDFREKFRKWPPTPAEYATIARIFNPERRIVKNDNWLEEHFEREHKKRYGNKI